MPAFTRRAFLGSSLSALGLALSASPGHAALARGLSLEELVRRSQRTLLVTPLAASCAWAVFGGQRAIVTDTRVRVDERLGRRVPDDGELLVRTLGGVIGDVGERVDGQAELTIGKPGLVFLVSAQGVDFVTGMAQGHYPLRRDARGVDRLIASPHLPKLSEPSRSAALQLTGADLPLTRRLIAEVPQ